MSFLTTIKNLPGRLRWLLYILLPFSVGAVITSLVGSLGTDSYYLTPATAVATWVFHIIILILQHTRAAQRYNLNYTMYSEILSLAVGFILAVAWATTFIATSYLLAASWILGDPTKALWFMLAEVICSGTSAALMFAMMGRAVWERKNGSEPNKAQWTDLEDRSSMDDIV